MAGSENACSEGGGVTAVVLAAVGVSAATVVAVAVSAVAVVLVAVAGAGSSAWRPLVASASADASAESDEACRLEAGLPGATGSVGDGSDDDRAAKPGCWEGMGDDSRAMWLSRWLYGVGDSSLRGEPGPTSCE